jgi:hypothetical protein
MRAHIQAAAMSGSPAGVVESGVPVGAIDVDQRLLYCNHHHPSDVAQVLSLALVCGTQPEGEGSAACECGQGEINGRFDVKAGGGEDRNGAVHCGNQQVDFGTTEDNAFGAGLGPNR